MATRWANGARAAAALLLALGLAGLGRPSGPGAAEAATWVVNRFDDPAPNGCFSATDCSLREAVVAANAGAGLDVIQVPTGVYTLTISGDDHLALVGDLDVTGETLIESVGGPVTVTVAAGLNQRVFEVLAASVTVTMTGLIISGGHPLTSTGGGIRLAANTRLWLQNVSVVGNTANDDGGGIFTSGQLILVDSVVAGNQALAGGEGGGVYTGIGGSVTLINTQVWGNRAEGSTTANGGGLAIAVGAQASLNSSTVMSNTATGSGGGFYNASVSGVTLEATRVVSNTGRSGGGLYNSGRLTFTTGQILSNTSTVDGGGGIRAGGNLTVTRSVVAGNVAEIGTGGGLAAFGTVTVTITNTTISGNRAQLSGGGLAATVTSAFFLTHVSVVSNTTVGGNGGGLQALTRGGLHNSLVAGNVDLGGSVHPDCTGEVLMLGYNLIADTTGCTPTGTLTSVLSNTLALTAPLADNGGDTLTHALLFGSPALGAANPATCAATDQRGVARPQGAGCDLGAWEGNPAAVILKVFLPLLRK